MMPYNAFTNPDNFSITGPVTVSNDPNSGAVGNLTMVQGGLVGMPTTVQTISATSGLITMTAQGRIARVIVTSNGTGISATLTPSATGSVTNGQEVTVINENPVSGSSIIVHGGVTGDVTILGAAAKKFIYDAALTIWTAA
jgi:hypothetical protein